MAKETDFNSQFGLNYEHYLKNLNFLNNIYNLIQIAN